MKHSKVVAKLKEMEKSRDQYQAFAKKWKDLARTFEENMLASVSENTSANERAVTAITERDAARVGEADTKLEMTRLTIASKTLKENLAEANNLRDSAYREAAKELRRKEDAGAALVSAINERNDLRLELLRFREEMPEDLAEAYIKITERDRKIITDRDAMKVIRDERDRAISECCNFRTNPPEGWNAEIERLWSKIEHHDRERVDANAAKSANATKYEAEIYELRKIIRRLEQGAPVILIPSQEKNVKQLRVALNTAQEKISRLNGRMVDIKITAEANKWLDPSMQHRTLEPFEFVHFTKHNVNMQEIANLAFEEAADVCAD